MISLRNIAIPLSYVTEIAFHGDDKCRAQAQWRGRRNALAKMALRIGAAKPVDAEFMNEAQKLISALLAEGKKNMATMSPGTVARLAVLLERLLLSRGLLDPRKVSKHTRRAAEDG